MFKRNNTTTKDAEAIRRRKQQTRTLLFADCRNPFEDVAIAARMRQILHTHQGRDKLFKCIMYFLRIYMWMKNIKLNLMFIGGAAEENFTLVERNYMTIMNSRRLFRLGRFVGEWVRIQVTLLKSAQLIYAPNQSKAMSCFVQIQMVLDVLARVLLFAKCITDDLAYISTKGFLHSAVAGKLLYLGARLAVPVMTTDLFLNSLNLAQRVLDSRHVITVKENPAYAALVEEEQRRMAQMMSRQHGGAWSNSATLDCLTATAAGSTSSVAADSQAQAEAFGGRNPYASFETLPKTSTDDMGAQVRGGAVPAGHSEAPIEAIGPFSAGTAAGMISNDSINMPLSENGSSSARPLLLAPSSLSTAEAACESGSVNGEAAARRGLRHSVSAHALFGDAAFADSAKPYAGETGAINGGATNVSANAANRLRKSKSTPAFDTSSGFEGIPLSHDPTSPVVVSALTVEDSERSRVGRSFSLLYTLNDLDRKRKGIQKEKRPKQSQKGQQQQHASPLPHHGPTLAPVGGPNCSGAEPDHYPRTIPLIIAEPANTVTASAAAGCVSSQPDSSAEGNLFSIPNHDPTSAPIPDSGSAKTPPKHVLALSTDTSSPPRNPSGGEDGHHPSQHVPLPATAEARLQSPSHRPSNTCNSNTGGGGNLASYVHALYHPPIDQTNVDEREAIMKAAEANDLLELLSRNDGDDTYRSAAAASLWALQGGAMANRTYNVSGPHHAQHPSAAGLHHHHTDSLDPTAASLSLRAQSTVWTEGQILEGALSAPREHRIKAIATTIAAQRRLTRLQQQQQRRQQQLLATEPVASANGFLGSESFAGTHHHATAPFPPLPPRERADGLNDDLPHTATAAVESGVESPAFPQAAPASCFEGVELLLRQIKEDSSNDGAPQEGGGVGIGGVIGGGKGVSFVPLAPDTADHRDAAPDGAGLPGQEVPAAVTVECAALHSTPSSLTDEVANHRGGAVTTAGSVHSSLLQSTARSSAACPLPAHANFGAYPAAPPLSSGYTAPTMSHNLPDLSPAAPATGAASALGSLSLSQQSPPPHSSANMGAAAAVALAVPAKSMSAAAQFKLSMERSIATYVKDISERDGLTPVRNYADLLWRDYELHWACVTQLKLILDYYVLLSVVLGWEGVRGRTAVMGLVSGLLSLYRVFVYGR